MEPSIIKNIIRGSGSRATRAVGGGEREGWGGGGGGGAGETIIDPLITSNGDANQE